MFEKITGYMSGIDLWGLFLDAIGLAIIIAAIIFAIRFVKYICSVAVLAFPVFVFISIWYGGKLHDNPGLASDTDKYYFYGLIVFTLVLGVLMVLQFMGKIGVGGDPPAANPFAGRSSVPAASTADDLQTYVARFPSYTFDDVQGMTGLKAALLAAVEKNRSAGKNGILLSGEPGNGKTMIAEALAGELRWRFMPITISDIQSRWIGQTTEQMKAVFESAKKNAPVVLFLDERDSMLRDRESMMGVSNDESLKVVNAFLTGIGDIRNYKDIIVIAATNYPDQLDNAAMRDKRFDFKIEVPAPDKEARYGLLTKFAKGITFEEGALDRLVKRWEGFSVARIINIAEKISDNAKVQGKKTVSMKEAMAALRAVQGSLGERLPENTPGLADMHFDEAERKKLMSLAKRMENIDEVERLGGQVPKGVLFFGPPGTGKTAVAKALAMTSGWAFLSTSGNHLLNNPEDFPKLLNKARDLRPCIVFIDEADDIL